jgi:hypothetical protein
VVIGGVIETMDSIVNRDPFVLPSGLIKEKWLSNGNIFIVIS